MRYLSIIFVALLTLLSSFAASAEAPLKEKDYSWMSQIRSEHPRMFLTKADIPQIRKTAFSFENKAYIDMKKRAEKLIDMSTGKPLPVVFVDPLAKTGEGGEDRKYGFYAADAAMMYLISGDQRYFNLARYLLKEVSAYYQMRVDNNLNIEWTAFSQICAMAAWDWIYNDLSEFERESIGKTLFNAMCDVAWHGPGIREGRYRENISAPTTGCYGVTVLPWYVGLTFYGEGYDDEFCKDMVRNGYDFHKKMTDFRSMMAGKNGGGASGAVNYSLAGYPYAEYDFIYTFRSSTGIDIADRMDYMLGYLNYMDWMRLPDNREFGFGDTNHYKCNLPHPYMNLHVKMLADIFGEKHPEILPTAARMLTQFKSRRPMDDIPFIRLLIKVDPSSMEHEVQEQKQKSVYFETMGQLCMRSGTGDDATYVMFVCGGIPKNHKHYDNNHFIIFKNGYRVLDSGTRPEPGWHLPYYYARTVAHNAVTIKMPGEVFPKYWGGPASVEEKNLKMPNDGGQCGLTDSKLLEHVETEDYVYVASDATDCYHTDKADLVVREFIWFAPDLFLVFDRMVSDKPEYEKRWLYHVADEPSVKGLQWSEKSQGGRSVVCTLFPKDAKVEKIGGPGKQFWSDGRNWPLPELTPDDYGYKNRGAVPPNNWPLVGQWRVEVKPAVPSKTDYFMHMIQVGDDSLAGVPKTKTFENEDSMGVEFKYNGKKYKVTFDKTARHGCKITVK
jgi:heparin/heparan-sulfate lyase